MHINEDSVILNEKLDKLIPYTDIDRITNSTRFYIVDSYGMAIPYIKLDGECVRLDILPTPVGAIRLDVRDGEEADEDPIPLKDLYDMETCTLMLDTHFKPGDIVSVFQVNLPEITIAATQFYDGAESPDSLYVICDDFDGFIEYHDEDDDEPFELIAVPATKFYDYCKVHAKALLHLTQHYGDDLD